jgi:hypothetical protein
MEFVCGSGRGELLMMARWFLILLLWMVGFLELKAEAIYMVCSSSSSWESVSKKDLRDLFIGKTKSLQRAACVPIILSKNPDYSHFIREVVRKTPQSFERNWKKLLFSGKATLPSRVDHLEEAYRLLREDDEKVCFSLTNEDAEGIHFILLR